MTDKRKDALFGLAVGDALGVPVEFKSREKLDMDPVTDMRGYGSHNQPPGTWSDDSSLTFCLADSLQKGYNLNDLAKKFVRWMTEAHWTPHGRVFDIGITTRSAINRLKNGTNPILAGGMDERENGNGSLMRILPLAFYLLDKPVEQRFLFVKEVSSLTHAHIRSVVACFIYIEFAIQLLGGKGKVEAYLKMQEIVNDFLDESRIIHTEINRFYRILKDNITDLYRAEIRSSGYVLHTLEASLWCILNFDTYAETVLQAVNLGEDTDTTGTVAGGLAGILYGYESIPASWIDQLARKEDIVRLAEGKYVS
ncbi:MAG: ADP-ribosylglycohydrolase family protein [Bacteroidota bacterium]